MINPGKDSNGILGPLKYSREIYLARWHGTCNAVYLKVVQWMEDPWGMHRVPAMVHRRLY